MFFVHFGMCSIFFFSRKICESDKVIASGDEVGRVAANIAPKIYDIGKSAFKIFKVAYTFLADIAATLGKGFKTILDGDNLKLFDKFDNLVAKGDDAVKTFAKKTADFTVQKFDDYVANIAKRNPAGNVNDPRRIYQERVAGLQEFEIKGGNNSKIWADGLDRSTGSVLEAKHIGNPGASPYIPGSSAPQFIRDQIIGQFRDELRRYADIIADPNSPLTKLDVITNNQAAKEFIENLLREYNIPGEVIIRP